MSIFFLLLLLVWVYPNLPVQQNLRFAFMYFLADIKRGKQNIAVHRMQYFQIIFAILFFILAV